MIYEIYRTPYPVQHPVDALIDDHFISFRECCLGNIHVYIQQQAIHTFCQLNFFFGELTH